jgi:hypothetical protein
VPSRISSLNILILLDKVYTKKLVIVPKFEVFFKGKPFLVSVSTKVKPQFPHIDNSSQFRRLFMHHWLHAERLKART